MRGQSIAAPGMVAHTITSKYVVYNAKSSRTQVIVIKLAVTPYPSYFPNAH